MERLVATVDGRCYPLGFDSAPEPDLNTSASVATEADPAWEVSGDRDVSFQPLGQLLAVIPRNARIHDSEVPMDVTSTPAFWEHIGSALKVVRVHWGIRQEDLARKFKATGESVSQSYISQVESGRERGGKGLTFQQLGLFCSLLGCKASDVIAVAESLAEDAKKSSKVAFNEVKRLVDGRLRDATCNDDETDCNKVPQDRRRRKPGAM